MEAESKNQLRNSAIGGAVWKFTERICAQLVSLAVSIVLARILVPEDYSVVSIVAVFFNFCNVLISGGFNSALIQKKNADELDYSTVLSITLVVSAVLFWIMFFCAPLIADVYHKPLLIPVIRVMSITFFINAVKSVLVAYTSSTLQFKKFFLSTISGTVISAVIGIAMAMNGFGPWALVAQQMVNSLVGTLILCFTTKLRLKFCVCWKRFQSLFSYGWKVFVASTISVIYDNCCPLIVGIRFSGADLAYYNKGKSFPSVINSSITSTISSVLFPIIAKVQDDTNAVLAMTRRYIKTASYVIFPVMIGFLAVSESFVRFLLTDKWIAVVPYIQIFCLSYMLDIIQVGNLQAIHAMGRSDIILVLEILKKSCYFAVIAAFVLLSDSPHLLALSALVCALVATVINTFPNRKLIGYKYRWQVKDLLPNLLLSIAMGVVTLLVGRLLLPSGLLLILQILAGVGVYILLSAATRNENFLYVQALIKQMLNKKK